MGNPASNPSSNPSSNPGSNTSSKSVSSPDSPKSTPKNNNMSSPNTTRSRFDTAQNKIFEIQQHYLLLLQIYCKVRAPKDPMLYVRLLTKLSEVQDLIIKCAD